jgi:hypothetical protein
MSIRPIWRLLPARGGYPGAIGLLFLILTLSLPVAQAADCVQDGNLSWELKTDDDGLRDKDNTYSWYDSSGTANNRGNPGTQNGGSCKGGIACDTQSYVQAVNAQRLCGLNDWRLPDWDELKSLVNLNRTPTIDAALFPETRAANYWTAATRTTASGNAWYINFQNGSEANAGKASRYYVRLVRGRKSVATCTSIGNLTWERKTGRGTLQGFDNTYTWYDPSGNLTNRGNPGTEGTLTGCSVLQNCDTQAYVDAVNAAKVCGYDDWRLPNWEELQSLVDLNYTPTIDPVSFPSSYLMPGTVKAAYWTAATAVNDNLRAWYIDFQDGSESTNYPKSANSRYVRLVRGPIAEARCVTLGNLTWELKSGRGTLRGFDNYYSWYDPNGVTNGGYAGTAGGLPGCHGILKCDTSEYIKALNSTAACGYTDWRMPTLDELRTLVNTGYTPTIDQTIFPPEEDRTRSGKYWSSSTRESSNQYAWPISFLDGSENYSSKSTGNYVRAVRSGATPPSTYTLSVSLTGNGAVVSNPTGINCGTTCSAAFPANTPVTLTATTVNGSTFTGWGGDCSGTGACNVSMNATRSVSATFTGGTAPPTTFKLTTAVVGNGTVKGAGTYAAKAPVTLEPIAAEGYTFVGWSPSPPCATLFTMPANDLTCTATFRASGESYPLNVALSGNGVGSVTSQPSGILCSNLPGEIPDCNETYAVNTLVTLTTTPGVGPHYFAGWSGACSGTGSCTVTLSTAKSVTATFATGYALTLTYNPDGSIARDPVGSNCTFASTTGDLQCIYAPNTVVTLSAVPAGGTFTGWGGGSCTGTGACQVTMTGNKTVSAAFTTGDPVSRLITHYYVSITERAPDPGGLAFWKGLVAEKQAQGADVKEVFRQMADFFFNSEEYLGRNTTDRQFITNLYRTFFQRQPDEGGYAFWLGQLAGGMSRNDAMRGFLYSPEFTAFMEKVLSGE